MSKTSKHKTTYILNFDNGATTGGGTDIDEQDLSHFYVVDLVVFAALVVLGADDALEEGRLHIDLDEDLRHCVRMPNYHPDHVVGARKLRIHLHTNSEQTARNRIHQMVLVSL